MPPAGRKRVLRRFAEQLRGHGDELALTETLDMGKPIADSLTVDIPGAARCIEWFGEAVDKVYDEVAPTARLAGDRYARTGRGGRRDRAVEFPAADGLLEARAGAGHRQFRRAEAVGEVAPDRTAGRGARGRGRAFRPACSTSCRDSGSTAGEALALHMDVDCVAFTGSTRIGRRMLEYSGQSNMKRVWLECGGKSPNIVFADVADLERAASAAAWGIFFNQGEMCSAASRLVAHADVKDELVERIVAIGRTLAPGDPLDPATRVGALVDAGQLQTVTRYIEAGRSGGAKLALGGRRVREETGGFFVEPTVFDGVDMTMQIAQEEIFGPVLSVLTFRDEAEAVRIANSVMYGLVSAVWTRDITIAHRVARAIRAGTVYVNCYDADDITVPFGGVKQSGNGRDKSLHALDKYTELKTTWIDLST